MLRVDNLIFLDRRNEVSFSDENEMHDNALKNTNVMVMHVRMQHDGNTYKNAI